MLSIFMLAFVVIGTAIPTSAGCPQGNTACTGLCVAVYGSGGSIDHYVCSTGATSAEKNCTQSDEELPY